MKQSAGGKSLGEYSCTTCGQMSAGWMGRCSGCGNFNTMQQKNSVQNEHIGCVETISLSEALMNHDAEKPQATGIEEFDTVTGGLAGGSIMLLGGEPGIGKSTLASQICISMSEIGWKCLIVCGEESSSRYASKIYSVCKGRKLEGDILFLDSSSVSCIKAACIKEKPALVIIDSVQTLKGDVSENLSANGKKSLAMLESLSEITTQTGSCIIAINHVIKSGDLAGPKSIEHLVDTVCLLEGERSNDNRSLRCVKNRYGSADRLGFFKMGETGLECVSNPEEIIFTRRRSDCSGVVRTVAHEGGRIMPLEIQSLVTVSEDRGCMRVSKGIENSRLVLSSAIIENSLKIPLWKRNLFLAIPGGLKISDTGIDLAVCVSIASSFYGLSVSRETAFLGEVSLSGEILSSRRLDARLGEVARFGFKRVVICSEENGLKTSKNLRVLRADSLSDAVSVALSEAQAEIR